MASNGLADILAKMRKVADSHASIGPSAIRVYADRIEEEVRRELAKEAGNAMLFGNGLIAIKALTEPYAKSEILAGTVHRTAKAFLREGGVE